VGVPSAARQAALLSIAAAELPSRAGAAPLSLSAGAAAPPRPALGPDQARRRLGELEAELARATAAEKIQYQLDGLQARLFKLEELLKGGQRLREALAEAETERAALQQVADAAAELGDAEAKLAVHARSATRRDEALGRVAAERAALAEAEAQGGPAPLWRDPLFLAGVGPGLLCLGLGAAGAAMGSELRTVALLDLPAFGWAGWATHRWIDRSEGWSRLARRHRVIDDWEQKIQEQFRRDGAELGAALELLGLTKPEELRDQLGRLGEADRKLAECRQRVAAWEADPETAGALAEKGRVEEDLRAAEAQLSGEAGGFVREVATVEAELERVRAEAEAPARPAAAEEAAPAPEPARPAALAAPGGEPLRGLLERAAAELGGSAASVARGVALKASQAIAGLTLNRLTGITSDDRGNVQIVTGGRPGPALTLPPADRDLVFLALKLALLEQAVAAGKTVAVLEDVFGGLGDGARRTIGRILKQAAKAGQILHATTDPAFRESADHRA
jgi:hypothetical protein